MVLSSSEPTKELPLEAVEIKIEPEEKLLNSAESTSSQVVHELDSKILMFIFHYLHKLIVCMIFN